jgi:hypothetical protein
VRVFKQACICAAAVSVFALACASVEPLGAVVELDAGLSLGGRPVTVPTGSGGASAPGPTGRGAGGFAPPVGAGGFMAPSNPFGMGGRPGAGGRAGVAGRTGAGGVAPAGAGGAPGAGGVVSVGGGTTAPPMCTSVEKMCGNVCVMPSPKVGCGKTGCDPCTLTAPANGYLTCTNGTCGVDCLSGYAKDGGVCEGPPPSTGGGSCPNSPLGCPDCGAVFGPGCCNGSKCGCSPIPWTVGILGCI